MAKQPKTTIGAAECARRTGLTVKALRVYERQGLITPVRSPQGWRLYGPTELARLNTIMVLKGLGLSLAQIREALAGTSTPLHRILQVQLDAWNARKAAADKAIALVEAALDRLQARKQLSIDELCTLIRSAETLNLQSATQEIMDEMFTAQEKMQWFLYSAKLPRAERAESLEHFEGARALASEIGKLIERGCDPGARDAQKVLARLNELALKYGFWEKGLARLKWNPTIARKAFTCGNRVLDRMAFQVPGQRSITDFIYAARDASPCGQQLDELLRHAKALYARKAIPASLAAQDLAKRLRKVCGKYSLGDPIVYAHWKAAYGLIRQASRWVTNDSATRAAWEYLASAANETPEPAD